jgi:hypothetical protein
MAGTYSKPLPQIDEVKARSGKQRGAENYIFSAAKIAATYGIPPARIVPNACRPTSNGVR